MEIEPVFTHVTVEGHVMDRTELQARVDALCALLRAEYPTPSGVHIPEETIDALVRHAAEQPAQPDTPH
ncbi:MAG TPA: hypothetical protein VK674_04685 [Candidatus Limnocylindria bacterium]|nr:hypothetical protein [Candidatus Limnocylindria bacterium]